MITTLTLHHEYGAGWIAHMANGDECYVPATHLTHRPGTEFTVVATPNRRDYPQWFAVRVRSLAMVKPEDVVAPVETYRGYSDAYEMAYAAGLCDKLTAYSRGKAVDNGNSVWYVSSIDNVYVEEYEK